MRRLSNRPNIPADVSNRLAKETTAIENHANPKAEAKRRYEKARKAAWFRPVVEALVQMAGPGGRCMFCSGSEASDVEHYRPKAVFPKRAMIWENYLWSCTICNRAKGDRFPPDTEPGWQILNPAENDPWQFFFVDQFGLLTPRYDSESGMPNPRAVSTCNILKLNRDALQESRQLRLKDLRKRSSELIEQHRSGTKCKSEIAREVENLIQQPFQSDVADYCLRGPGTQEEPFKTLLETINK